MTTPMQGGAGSKVLADDGPSIQRALEQGRITPADAIAPLARAALGCCRAGRVRRAVQGL